jgi:hypothetical protein
VGSAHMCRWGGFFASTPANITGIERVLGLHSVAI